MPADDGRQPRARAAQALARARGYSPSKLGDRCARCGGCTRRRGGSAGGRWRVRGRSWAWWTLACPTCQGLALAALEEYGGGRTRTEDWRCARTMGEGELSRRCFLTGRRLGPAQRYASFSHVLCTAAYRLNLVDPIDSSPQPANAAGPVPGGCKLAGCLSSTSSWEEWRVHCLERSVA